MPDLDPGFPMDPAPGTCCPTCDSADVNTVEAETGVSLNCLCNACSHQWEEYLQDVE